MNLFGEMPRNAVGSDIHEGDAEEYLAGAPERPEYDVEVKQVKGHVRHGEDGDAHGQNENAFH